MTNKELNELKEKLEYIKDSLKKLSDEELQMVFGGQGELSSNNEFYKKIVMMNKSYITMFTEVPFGGKSTYLNKTIDNALSSGND